MSSEAPRFERYQAIVCKTEDLTIAQCRDQEIDEYALLRCIMAALEADAEGISRQEIAEAVQEGLRGGVTLYQNMQHGGRSLDYWRAVRQEAGEQGTTE